MAGRRSKTAWLAARAAPDCNSRLRIGGSLLFVFVLALPVVKTNALAWALDFFLACKRDARRGHHEPHRDNQNSVYFVHIRPPSSDHSRAGDKYDQTESPRGSRKVFLQRI